MCGGALIHPIYLIFDYSKEERQRGELTAKRTKSMYSLPNEIGAIMGEAPWREWHSPAAEEEKRAARGSLAFPEAPVSSSVFKIKNPLTAFLYLMEIAIKTGFPTGVTLTEGTEQGSVERKLPLRGAGQGKPVEPSGWRNCGSYNFGSVGRKAGRSSG